MLCRPRYLVVVPLILLLPLLALSGPAVEQVTAQERASISEAELQAFHPRSIGPAVTGGRIHDVEALPGNPSVLYVATASGGLWKTTNRGHSWVNLFEHMPISTFGDVAIAPSNPDIIYAGTGEQNNRQSTSWGYGLYRSDDAGGTWTHLGLEETRHIGKVEVHPTNPDIVYVAGLGNLWKESEERGVFKSTDGGRSWDKVLHIDERTGVVDMVMDPSDPQVLYAAAYQRLRRTWGFNGGGPGSGIYKTTDGGRSWQELTNGIPEGDKGRIGLAIAYSNPRVLMAVIQHADADLQGTYRSEDAGATWERVNSLNPRPMYYSEIFIDPNEEDRVYILGTSSSKSEDGGRSFEEIAVRPSYDVGVHADHHTLWIDPNDSDHLYLAGDAGLHESYDRGVNFRKLNNFVIGQFYAIGVDMRDPYWIYGGMQDNHSWMGPSRTRHWIGILNDDWRQIGFGDGMYWQIDPTNFRFAYGNAQNGSYTRFDPVTGDMLDIRPIEPAGEDYRWDWVSPSLVSRHDPNVVYVGGNRLFISRDRGESWARTEDLSRAVDRDELELMGVKGRDITISRNDGTSSYGEIVTLAESPFDPAILWVGTDDGNLQLSRDGGRSWTEVGRNVRGVRNGTYVSRIVASVSAPGTAYATFDAHRDGDFAPYVFRTRDFGATWEVLVNGLPTGSVNSLVEHPDNPDLLFLGTEHHLFTSTDAGATWMKMPNLPTTHYDDLVIHPREKDLVIGTHGRSIFILDDTRPLSEWTAAAISGPAHLFTIRQATIMSYWKDTSYRGQAEYAGENPPDGAIITYRLGAGGGEAVLRVTNPAGEVVREMQVPSGEGLHRINWDLRHGTSDQVELWRPHDTSTGLPRPADQRGPEVSPGVYTVALNARGVTSTQYVVVRGDPELDLTPAQYRAREEFLLGMQTLSDEIQEAVLSVVEMRRRDPERADEIEARLRDLQRQARRRGLSSGSVRQGSLHPPTQTQRDAAAAVRAALKEILMEIRRN